MTDDLNAKNLVDAHLWRENLRSTSPLIEVLAGVQGPTLVGAYLLWWQTYTEGIRNAPSNNRREGVSSAHASAAGHAANDAVLAFLSVYRGEQR